MLQCWVCAKVYARQNKRPWRCKVLIKQTQLAARKQRMQPNNNVLSILSRTEYFMQLPQCVVGVPLHVTTHLLFTTWAA